MPVRFGVQLAGLRPYLTVVFIAAALIAVWAEVGSG